MLSSEEKVKIQEQSRCILDTPLPTQSGITMRVIEGLVLKKKIITTNYNIVNYDFYNKEDFFVFSEDNFYIDKNKLKTKCKYQVDNKYYSSKTFVVDLLKTE